MKIYEERTVPEHVVKITQAIVCDLCGKRSEDCDWSSKSHEIVETTVSLEERNGYGDSGDIKETSYDICPDCFRTKLMPFLAEHGAKPTVEERVW